VDGLIIFARWRQCAPDLIHASLGPPESKSQVASASAQQFFCKVHLSRYTLQWAAPSPYSCPFQWGI